jgi:hypothetical protein
VTAVVAISCVLAVVVVGVGTYELAMAAAPAVRGHYTGIYIRSLFEPSWRHLIPALWMAVLFGVAAIPRSTTSRSMRLAIVIPLGHALALVVAAIAVQFLDVDAITEHAPYVEMLPMLPWFVSGLGAMLVVGGAIGGRREWAHAFVTLALAFLLLFALWLPIGSLIPVTKVTYFGTYRGTIEFLEAQPVKVAAIMIAPPFVVAAIYAALPGRIRTAFAFRIVALCAVGMLFMMSMAARMNGSRGSFAVHDNFTHLLLAAVMLAIVATATLSLSTWLSSWFAMRRLARDARELTVSDDEGAVATLAIAGWLRGPQMFTRSFIASDGKQEIRVPAGARIVAAVPKLSSLMKTGQQTIVVTQRDRLRIGGLVASKVGDSPFRSHDIIEVGPELVIARAEPISTPVETMLLTAWRPSIAYAIIVVAAAVPSLLGLIATVRD